MNRERKYRVWDKGEKKMYFPEGNLFIQLGSVFGNHLRCEIADVNGDKDCTTNPESYVIMDYLLLLDSKGNQICEGDILCGDFPNLIVGWCAETASFGASKTQDFSIDNMYWFGNDIHLIRDGWEVCGNIFTTPELLNP